MIDQQHQRPAGLKVPSMEHRTIPTTTEPDCSLAPLPLVQHWHLLKTGGTAIRNTHLRLKYLLKNSEYQYQEAEAASWASFLMGVEAKRALDHLIRLPNATRACSLRRFIVLREPYSQFLSEAQHFDDKFSSYRADDATHADHLVCNWLGLCSQAAPGAAGVSGAPRCSAPLALETLERGVNFVGFMDHLDDVYWVLRAWAGCERRGSAADRAIAKELAAAALASERHSPQEANATRRIVELEAHLVRLRRGHAAGVPGLQRGIDRGEHRIDVLRRMPSRSAFAVRNRCSLDFWHIARGRYGPRGAVTQLGQQDTNLLLGCRARTSWHER